MIASEIVMVNGNVKENKMVTVTENIWENVIVSEIEPLNSTLMVIVIEKGSYMLDSLLLHSCIECHC